MRKALVNTKVTVKLRKSVHHADEWYLFIESYPVYKRGEAKAKRVIEALNRTISTPVWDVSSVARILPDGSFNYKPKRDMNGIIQCKSRLTKRLVSMLTMSERCVSMNMIAWRCILTENWKSWSRRNEAHKTSSNISMTSSTNGIPTVLMPSS